MEKQTKKKDELEPSFNTQSYALVVALIFT